MKANQYHKHHDVLMKYYDEAIASNDFQLAGQLSAIYYDLEKGIDDNKKLIKLRKKYQECLASATADCISDCDNSIKLSNE